MHNTQWLRRFGQLAGNRERRQLWDGHFECHRSLDGAEAGEGATIGRRNRPAELVQRPHGLACMAQNLETPPLPLW